MSVGKKHHLIQLGYFLSILLFMSGAIYFFASNWAELTKPYKITLSVSLMLGMYVVAYLGKRILPHWFMVSGTIAFGITLALLDQIYNSHPESYTIFLIWLIPAVLYAIVTKMDVYKILTYVLFQLGFFFLVDQVFTIEVEMYVLLALFNIALFFLIEMKWLHSALLKYISFASFHFWMIVSSTIIIFDRVDTLIYYTKWVYMMLVIPFIYIYVKRRPQKALFAISTFGLVIYAIITFFDILFEAFEEYVFVFGLLFVIALVALTVYAIRRWKLDNYPFIAKVITGGVTAFATIVGTISVVGFFIITVGVDTPEFFYFFGVLLILCTIWITNPTISYTMILMGCLISSVPAFDDLSLMYFVIIWGIVTVVMVLKKSHGIRSLLFFYMNLTVFVRFSYDYNLWDSNEERLKWIILLLVILNIVLYAVKKLPQVFRINAFIYALLFLLYYTQQTFENFYFYILVQILFFAINLFLLFWTRLKEYSLQFWSAFIIFVAFLLLTYYDFVWKLLHKSIALFLLGTIFFVVTWLIHRKYVLDIPNENSNRQSKRIWLIGILILQLVIVGWQIGQKEFLLQTGTEIKLELAPIDPRSMMQGDYVILNYKDVSAINSNVLHRLGSGVIQIVLREQAGVYQYAGYYKHRGAWNLPYAVQDGDVILKGRVMGFNMYFGIEQYYVPEGTGRDIEEFAKYALVKVGKSGDAIVVGLSDR